MPIDNPIDLSTFIGKVQCTLWDYPTLTKQVAEYPMYKVFAVAG